MITIRFIGMYVDRYIYLHKLVVRLFLLTMSKLQFQRNTEYRIFLENYNLVGIKMRKIAFRENMLRQYRIILRSRVRIPPEYTEVGKS
jgi:hypothetical protein